MSGITFEEREIIRAKKREYYQKNKDRICKYAREYRAKHRDKVIKQQKAYYQRNKEYFDTKRKEYLEDEKNGPKLFREYIRQLIKEYEEKNR